MSKLYRDAITGQYVTEDYASVIQKQLSLKW